MIATKLLSPPSKLTAPPPPSSIILLSHFSSAAAAATSSPHHRFNLLRQHTPAAEEDLPVAVWWDVDTCPIPEHGVKLSGVAKAITAAVRGNGMNGPVEISAVADVFQLPRYTWRALHESGIAIAHLPNYFGGELDSFKSTFNQLMKWASQNPPPAHLLLITDKDFAITMHHLRKMNYNILAATDRIRNPDLYSDASIVWRWTDLVKGSDLTGKHFNQPPWHGRYNELLLPSFSVDQAQQPTETTTTFVDESESESESDSEFDSESDSESESESEPEPEPEPFQANPSRGAEEDYLDLKQEVVRGGGLLGKVGRFWFGPHSYKFRAT